MSSLSSTVSAVNAIDPEMLHAYISICVDSHLFLTKKTIIILLSTEYAD